MHKLFCVWFKELMTLQSTVRTGPRLLHRNTGKCHLPILASIRE